MLAPESEALLDSGNAAFRARDFDGALAFYARAAQASPTHAAPWFGTYMVGKATNNEPLADSALREVRARAPDMQPHPPGAPGAAPTMPSPYSPHAPGARPRGTS